MNIFKRYDPEQRISVAVDCIIFGFDSNKLKLLLFRRNVEPLRGHWSLIGAILKNDISLRDGAKEILFQSTGLKEIYVEQLKTYGRVDRDPADRVISVAYYGLIRINEFDTRIIEKHDAKWFDIDEVPNLILDHDNMVIEARRELRLKAKHQPVGFELLSEYFTLPQLQKLYECIYGATFDPRNFRKKILSLGIIENTGKKDKSGSRKGAFLYKFLQPKINGTSQNDGTFNTIKDVVQFFPMNSKK